MNQEEVDKIIERVIERIERAKEEIDRTLAESRPRTEQALADLRRAGLLRD